MCFLKSRKQLNNHIIWLAKYRRTSLLGCFFFQGIKSNFHVTLWDMTVAWAAITGKSFYSAAWALHTFCPALWNSSSCRNPFVFSLYRSNENMRKAEDRTLNALQLPVTPSCECVQLSQSSWISHKISVFNLLLLSDTLPVLTNRNKESHHI